MAGPSNTTASTICVVSSCSSVTSSMHPTMSALLTSLRFPLADSDSGHGRFS